MLFGKTLLVTFEGMDGSGKTTLMRAVENRLRELGETNFVSIAEPGTEQIEGFNFREILANNSNLDPFTEIFLHTAYRRENVTKFIKPKLDSGVSVFQDRFALSTFAYNVFPFQETNPDVADLFMGTMSYVIGNDLPEPITFYLEVPKDVRFERLSKDRELLDRYESDDTYQELVAQAYEQIKQSPSVITLDGTKDTDTLTEEVIETIRLYVEKQKSEVEAIREELSLETPEVSEAVELDDSPFDPIENINILASSIIYELNQFALSEERPIDFEEYKSLIVNVISKVMKNLNYEGNLMKDRKTMEEIKAKVIPVIYYGSELKTWEVSKN